MVVIDDETFADLISDAFETLPRQHIKAIQNVAIVYDDDPTPEQRIKLELRHDQTLLGLYEGTPLAQRQGMTSYGPDKITLFKNPICMSVNSMAELKEQIRHTLWHEVAHYFGLNHAQIRDLES